LHRYTVVVERIVGSVCLDVVLL